MNDIDHRLSLPLTSYPLSVRTHTLLERAGLTMAQVSGLTDRDLMETHGLGRKSVIELRELIKSIKFGALSLREDLVAWVHEHETLVTALVRGEAFIVPRE